MKPTLELIEKYLDQLAPKIRQSLQPGLSLQDLDELGVSLPEALKKLYLWKNGIHHSEISNLFYGFSFHSLDYIKSNDNGPIVDLNTSSLSILDDGIISKGGVIRFFEIGNDSGRCFFGVNLTNNAGNASTFQILVVDMEYQAVLKVADSVEDMVDQFLMHLKDGKYQLNEEAKEDGEEFLETDRSIDYINWFRMEKYEGYKLS